MTLGAKATEFASYQRVKHTGDARARATVPTKPLSAFSTMKLLRIHLVCRQKMCGSLISAEAPDLVIQEHVPEKVCVLPATMKRTLITLIMECLLALGPHRKSTDSEFHLLQLQSTRRLFKKKIEYVI